LPQPPWRSERSRLANDLTATRLVAPGLLAGRLRSDFGRVSRKGPGFKGVMAGLVPAIHVFRAAYPIRQQQGAKGFVPVRSVADMRDRPSGGAAWMAGTSPATTAGYRRAAKKAATASLVFRSRRHKQLQPVIKATLSRVGWRFGCADRRGPRAPRSRGAASPRSTVPAPQPGRGRCPVRRCRLARRRSRSDSRRRHSAAAPAPSVPSPPREGPNRLFRAPFSPGKRKPNLGGPRRCEAAERTGRFSTLGKSVLVGPPLGESPWLCLPAD
jgi:hypothetical protein